MLKKLYKHEFYALFRSLLLIYAVVLGLAGLSRITFLFDIENEILSTIAGFSVTFYIFAILATFILAMVIVVVRFYKNLLSHEGYLTFTLPFTPTEHIVCKLICGAVVMAISTAVVIASLLILGAGTDILSQIFNGINTAYTEVKKLIPAGAFFGAAAELAIILILSPFQSLLMYFTAIAIGQQFKSKIGGAVIAYFCLNAASQMIMTILMSVMSVVMINVNIDDLNNAVTFGTNTFMTVMGITIIFQLALCAAYFFITRYFLTKKLNLE